MYCRPRSTLLAVLTCCLTLAQTGMEAQNMPYRWEQVTMNAAFAPRDGAGALTLNGRMYLLGGWNPGDKANFPIICNDICFFNFIFPLCEHHTPVFIAPFSS